MTLLVASDLDGTLIFSSRRAGSALPENELVCVEYIAGVPASFLSRAAAAGLLALSRDAVVVPVTARSREQFGRLELPWPVRHAVIANGGLILFDGVVDQSWTARVGEALRDVARLGDVRRHLDDVCRPQWTKKIVEVESLFCCAVVEASALPAAFVAEQEAWARSRGWRTSLQGSKFYVVPEPLTKSSAVAEIAERIGARTTIAAGDALLDADLLSAAARGAYPSAGELATRGWSAPHVVRLPGAGVLGGAQIVTWLRMQVDQLQVEARSAPPTPGSTAAATQNEEQDDDDRHRDDAFHR